MPERDTYDTDLTLLREYEPHELGADGYPLLWHDGIPEPEPEDGTYGVKHQVRYEAGWRCERCAHPYPPGCGVMESRGQRLEPVASARAEEQVELFERDEPGFVIATEAPVKKVHWSRCDERCAHGAPYRYENPAGGWEYAEADEDVNPAGAVVRLGGARAVEAAWRILTVHHLNGRKHDLRWWNLAALCQRCHLTIQRKVTMERVWPAEHTDWFKPHAAGWYAYAYLGENLTRAQVLERQDELLGLELAGA